MARLKPTQLEKTIKNINDKSMYGLTLDNIKPYYAVVNNEDIFCDILLRIANNPQVDTYVTFMNRLVYAINNFYTKVVTEPENIPHFYNLLNIYLDNPELVTDESLENINYAFSDKSLIYEIYLYLNQPHRFKDLNGVKVENINLITQYLIQARELYVDDRSLFTSFINLIENKLGLDVLKYGTEKQIEKAIAQKIKSDRKINGDYDIDESIIREFDRKIESMGLLRSSLDTLIEISESERNNLASSIENAQEEITNKRIQELKNLSDEARKKISEFNNSYLELIKQQKQRVYDDRDTLIAEIDDYISSKKQELELLVDKVANDIAIEISRIRKVSTDSISSIKSYVSNDENISRVIKEANNNKNLFDKIAFVEELASKMSTEPIVPSESGQRIVTSTTEKVVIPNQTIIVPIENVDEVVDYTVNYYFDKSKKYKERFKKIMANKEKLVEQGEIFHEKFDDIVAMVIENDCPYMYGPSGCGKTYMIEEQLAKLFNMPIITNGYILYEQDVIGYNNAGNGDYVKTNFYRAFKAGKILFFDEIDNSNANATTILNPFLKRSGNTSYAFPNGESVARHPNFRIIAAGNTKGTGRTVAHNTRQKMDESVMQRFTPIEIGYDNRIEKRILKDYPGWFEFAVSFRNAIAANPLYCAGDEINSIGTFTTRDAETIRDYKDDGAFSDELLIDYQIIENKDTDYLEQIRSEMKSSSFTTDEGKKLLRIFNDRVEAKKRNAKRNY